MTLESAGTLKGFLRVAVPAGWPVVAAGMWLGRRGAARLGWEGLWASALAAACLAAGLYLAYSCLRRQPAAQGLTLSAAIFAVVFLFGLAVAAFCARALPGSGFLAQSAAVTVLSAAASAALLTLFLP